MGVYLNSFRTAHKVASFNGVPVKVYSYQFLCRAGDEDTYWSRNETRAKRIQASLKQAEDKFAEHQPKFICDVSSDNWENVVVHANPTASSYYDSDDKRPYGEAVGFLVRAPKGRGWSISVTRYGEEKPIVAGNTVTRRYMENLVDGKIVRKIIRYTFANGYECDEAQFEAWRAEAEPKYVVACQQRQAEHEKQQADAAAARKARQEAKDAEIASAQETLTRLKQERAAL